MNCRLTLLCRAELEISAEHIDAGDAEGAVGSHSLAERVSLLVEAAFLHHMSGERDAVIVAPLSAIISKRFCEAVANVIVISVARK
jgi:hypothetical protein